MFSVIFSFQRCTFSEPSKSSPPEVLPATRHSKQYDSASDLPNDPPPLPEKKFISASISFRSGKSHSTPLYSASGAHASRNSAVANSADDNGLDDNGLDDNGIDDNGTPICLRGAKLFSDHSSPIPRKPANSDVDTSSYSSSSSPALVDSYLDDRESIAALADGSMTSSVTTQSSTGEGIVSGLRTKIVSTTSTTMQVYIYIYTHTYIYIYIYIYTYIYIYIYIYIYAGRFI